MVALQQQNCKITVMNYHLLTVAILFAIVGEYHAYDDTEFYCNPSKSDRLDVNQGILVIKRNVSECGFLTLDNDLFFMLKTDNLLLKDGDTFSIGSESEKIVPQVYRPPFDTGYFLSGIVEPKITFGFSNLDNTTMRVRFFQNQSIVPVNGDLNNDFHITTTRVKSLTLSFIKTVPEPIHLEVVGGAIEGTALKHKLITQSEEAITVNFEVGSTINVRTSSALANCSGVFSDPNEVSHEINGPVSPTGVYKCVNLYSTTMQNQAHYEADFTNFTGLFGQLTLDDGSDPLYIISSAAKDYIGQRRSFKGKELAVVYESPKAIGPNSTQFKLALFAKQNGGVIDKPGVLSFPAANSPLRYVLDPGPQKYAAIEISSNTKLQDTNLTISSGLRIIAVFGPNTILPPVIALNEPNQKMVLDFSTTKSYKLANSISFKPLDSHCHRITTGIADGFSVLGGHAPCYWTIASTESVALKIGYNDLLPGGCLTINSLLDKNPIYSKCNISRTDVIPTIHLGQAYLNVTLPPTARFDASLISYTNLFSYEPTSKVIISSPGYPSSYAWSNGGQFHTLNATGKNYLLTITDVDLRNGEKLLINNVGVNVNSGDIIISNALVNITVDRSKAVSSDWSNHRGFNIIATMYDQAISVDTLKKRIAAPSNMSTIIKIYSNNGTHIPWGLGVSSPGSKQVGKRITFNITSQGFNVTVFDGPSTKAKSISSMQGSTTSNTLLISYQPQVGKPDLVVDYVALDCNETSHICDDSTRCVPIDLLCKGIPYCSDGSDLRVACDSGPAPQPKIIDNGVGGMTVFVLCVFMLTLGAVSALYGPDIFKSLENRFRSGQYTTFTSSE